ncbi:hypothetical protein CGGC5_v010211 [Colletotrichum fructicola Nara gc5]|uniref:Uncharacterized protein n=1 Tax=Colletotrichum fructicola (strain Nara gc5) TaxID=1213859 RepID=A0A7J6J0H0_COLFN|nr:hypothetical protein CGGC5_v010211 [Colletotrichum fructicola Nara gc5]
MLLPLYLNRFPPEISQVVSRVTVVLCLDGCISNLTYNVRSGSRRRATDVIIVFVLRTFPFDGGDFIFIVVVVFARGPFSSFSFFASLVQIPRFLACFLQKLLNPEFSVAGIFRLLQLIHVRLKSADFELDFVIFLSPDVRFL